jgi:hypothetical protein
LVAAALMCAAPAAPAAASMYCITPHLSLLLHLRLAALPLHRACNWQ